MPEIEHPETDSEQGQADAPLAPQEVEQLRDGTGTIESPFPRPGEQSPASDVASQRAIFIEQAGAVLRHQAARASMQSETLSHNDDPYHAQPHNAELARKQAEELTAQADQAERDAAAEFDAEHPAA